MAESVVVRLEHLPAARFHRAVTYLEDVLRECQLVLIGPPPEPTDRAAQDLHRLATALVPDLEEIRDVFRAADVSEVDARLDLVVAASPMLAATMAHLQTHLVQLRYVGRRGALLVESDPTVSAVLTWIWDEAADQLHGRPARPFPPPSP